MASNGEKLAKCREINRRLAKMAADDAERLHARGIAMLEKTAAELGIDLNAPEPEPDYEALGYLETDCGVMLLDGGLEGVADVVLVIHRWIHSMANASDDELRGVTDSG